MKQPKKENTQSVVFVEAAKALKCDESEERFDEMLKKVAQHKPRDSAADVSEKIEENPPSK